MDRRTAANGDFGQAGTARRPPYPLLAHAGQERLCLLPRRSWRSAAFTLIDAVVGMRSLWWLAGPQADGKRIDLKRAGKARNGMAADGGYAAGAGTTVRQGSHGHGPVDRLAAADGGSPAGRARIARSQAGTLPATRGKGGFRDPDRRNDPALAFSPSPASTWQGSGNGCQVYIMLLQHVSTVA